MKCSWCNEEFDGRSGYESGGDKLCGIKCLREKIGYPPDPLPRKEVISIQPGDVIVVDYHDRDLSDKAVGMAKDKIKEYWPNNKCLVLGSGITLEVYREQGRYVDVSNADGVKRTLDTQAGKVSREGTDTND